MPEPLTDAELDEILEGRGERDTLEDYPRLVAEIRRLRTEIELVQSISRRVIAEGETLRRERDEARAEAAYWANR